MAGLGSNVVDFIKSIWGRESTIKQDAAAGISVGDIEQSSSPTASLLAGGLAGLEEQLKVDNDLMARFVDYEEMDEYPDLACLSGDTLIRTTEGSVKIKELAERGGSFHVFSVDLKNKEIVIAKAHSARITGKKNQVKKMIGVELDNGAVVRCTPDHLFMMRDGSYKQAQELNPCDSLMPFGTKVWTGSGPYSGRLKVYQYLRDTDKGTRWECVHRLVAKAKYGDEYRNGIHAHHKDGDKLNNSWDNILLMSARVHKWTDEERKEKSDVMKGNNYALGNNLSDETKRKMSIARKGKKKTEEWKNKIGLSQPNRIPVDQDELYEVCKNSETIKKVAEAMGWSWSKAKREVVKYGFKLKKGCPRLSRFAVNHKVLRIYEVEPEDVYDLTVPCYHNFAIGAGIFIHNSTLDIYADDATIVDSRTNRTLWVKCKDQDLKEDLDNVYNRNVMVEENAWGIVRSLCKYGNDFEEILLSDDGVVGLNFLPAATMRRIETKGGITKGFIQSYSANFGSGGGVEYFEEGPQWNAGVCKAGNVNLFRDWRVTHMRLRSKTRKALYGTGILDPARWIWKRLVLLEDAALIYRLTRSPARFGFYIDVGKVPPQKARAILRKYKQELKKKKFVNPKTGKIDFKYNPLCLSGDTKIPLLDGRTVALRQLVAEHEKGKENWVYSIDRDNDNNVVPGKIVWAGGTRKNAKIVKVTLDNGKCVKCTPDHKWMLRNGEYKEAKDLSDGDSVMPWKALLSRNHKVISINHNVVSVEDVNEREDTFTLTIDKHHNFALAAGAYVKNSQDEDYFLPIHDGKEKVRIDPINTPSWQCLHGDTIIPLLSGDRVSLKELSKNYKGEDIWVYSIDDDGHIVPGRGRNPRITERKKIWKVKLDNGMIVKCSDNHPWMMRFGKYVQTKNLHKDFKLMPFPNGCEVGVCSDFFDFVKVSSIEETDEWVDMYDITVEKYHNFAIEAGVFVHNSMDDIEYFRNKLHAATKVPRAYLGYDENQPSRATLSQESVRFARTVLRVQREFRNGMHKVGRVHLAARKIDPGYVDFEVMMSTPDSIFELAQMEVESTRANFARDMESWVSKHWILSKIFNLSDTEIEQIMVQRQKEAVTSAEAEAAAEKVRRAAEEGGGGGGGRYRYSSKQKDNVDRDLLVGNRDHEKRLEDNFDKMMKNNQYLMNQLNEMKGFMNELKMSIGTLKEK